MIAGNSIGSNLDRSSAILDGPSRSAFIVVPKIVPEEEELISLSRLPL